MIDENNWLPDEIEGEVLQIEVTPEEAGSRLDLWLFQKGIAPSRSHGQIWIRDERVTLHGKALKANYKVRSGDQIQVSKSFPQPVAIGPEDIPISIVHEDEDVVVINKPAGLVVHPAEGHHSGTLVNALLYHIKDLSGINGEIRPGIVHRIDKDTSGLLVVAKNDKAHIDLANQVKEHRVQRDYLALVHGIVPAETGRIDAPIGRDPQDRQKMAVISTGKAAVTHFVVKERFPVDAGFSLLQCSLETGRTHQIRVHLAYMGHPVAGDPKYGPRKSAFNLKGQALHAWRLQFQHPRSQEMMTFEAEAPEVLLKLLGKLRQKD
ncbi:RluA family pseudouridine synthase [Heliorestis convoluta]|uniref:Pseudouridine synthase n=1 Tax=Heliorestis convoluta TaxID=356322 RepID=A0A5Q2N294_9FIRM|nr:RluA family pseudouridine synthase [Heliorestis convoluta]QGG47959.1 pseudouridine synthase [Heliorestis convoluta]